MVVFVVDIIKFFNRARTILYKVKKPKSSEYWTTSRVVMIGSLILGITGLITYFLFSLMKMLAQFVS